MRKYIFFLKCSSVLVKVAAWIFLLLGIAGSAAVFFGPSADKPKWLGVMVLIIYSSLFAFLFFVAKIADILVKVINVIDKE
jgi:hypothetical protein